MRLSNQDIATRLASLIDLALDDLTHLSTPDPRIERINALLNVARDGLERLAGDLPAHKAAIEGAIGGNVVAFPARRVAS